MSTSRQLIVTDVLPDTDEGEAARLLDPLWALARQWQMGELQAEDNGSPVQAQVEVEATLLSNWQAGANAAVAYDASARPLEAHVEGESWHTAGAPHSQLAAETGLMLQALLSQAGLVSAAVLLKQRALLAAPADLPNADARRRARLWSGRALDGLAVRRALLPHRQADGSVAASVFQSLLNGCSDPQATVLSVLTSWLGTWDAFLPGQVEAPANAAGTAPAWQSSRQEYSFSLGARLEAGTLGLLANEHRGGSADWHDFVVTAAPAGLQASASRRKRYTFLPTPVRFGGMPNARFWAFEDGNINLPQLRTHEARQDAASQLFVDFALRYGNDWFMLPLPLPVGSLSRLHGLLVRNTFGETFQLPHASRVNADAGQLFALSLLQNAPSVTAAFSDVFLLPATAGHAASGAAVEEVRMTRDELANLAWAVEQTVESAVGTRVDRVEQSARARVAEAPPSGSGALRYRLGTDVPPHWVPLVPERGYLLRRAALPRFTPHGVETMAPLGRVLEPGRELVLQDEEVPREGVLIERRYRFARSASGRPTLWMARRKGPGQGGTSSGLTFDVVEPKR
jgi:hypothetical protein